MTKTKTKLATIPAGDIDDPEFRKRVARRIAMMHVRDGYGDLRKLRVSYRTYLLATTCIPALVAGSRAYFERLGLLALRDEARRLKGARHGTA